MPKQRARSRPTVIETGTPAESRRDENVIIPYDPTEDGYVVAVISSRDDSEAAKHGLMTMREAADFLMEDEGTVEALLAAADVPVVYENGLPYVARRELRIFRDRDIGERRQHLRELTRRSIEAGLDDVDYSRLSDQP